MIQRSQNGFLQVLGIVHWKKNVKISRQSNIVTKSGTRTSFKETNVQIDLLTSSIYASSPHSYISQSGLKTYQYYAEFLGAEQNNCVFLQASNSCYVIQQWDSLWINLFPVMTLWIQNCIFSDHSNIWLLHFQCRTKLILLYVTKEKVKNVEKVGWCSFYTLLPVCEY